MKKCLVLSVKSGKSSHDLAAGAYQRAGDPDKIAYYSAAYSDLRFLINNDTFSIKVFRNESLVEIDNFDMIYLFLVGSNLSLASAISLYAEHNNILYLPGDLSRIRPEVKLLQAVHFYVDNVPTIPTFFSKKYDNNLNQLPFKIPFVYKANFGTRGRDNYLVETKEQWQKLANQDKEFIVQPYIKNAGDYRVLCLGFEAKLVIKRTAKQGSYINNTSQGAKAELINQDEMPEEALSLAESAARALSNEVAGVDIVQDKEDGNWYVIELNQSPQISTGAFTKQKLRAFTQFIESKIDS